MKKNPLASRTRTELVTLARALGVHGATRLPKPALAAVIQAVRSGQAVVPTVRLDHAELSFDRPGRVKPLTLRNRSGRPLRVPLDVLAMISGIPTFAVP